MEKLKFYSLVPCVLFLLFNAAPAVGSAREQQHTPLEVIRQSNLKVQEILNVHKTVDEKTGVQLLTVIDGITSFETISHRVIDRFCKKLTKAQCETFDRIFQQLLRVSSLKKMGRYRADKFDYMGEEIDKNTAVVKTTAYYREEKAQLDYHLELLDGKWKIVNYVVDDIDTIRNYKKQFIRLFTEKSFDQVMERLKKKIAHYREENRNQDV